MPSDAEPAPELLEMVGRLAGLYCPSLLSTAVVEIARSALDRRTDQDMDAVEADARVALDAAVAGSGGSPVRGDRPR